MSESKDILQDTTMTRAQRDAAEDAKHRKTAKIYGFATLLLLVAAVAAVIWNTGYIQSNATAANVAGEKISVAELGYYYNAAMQEEAYNSYYYGSNFDSTRRPQDQPYADGKTYHDYFLETALGDVQSIKAMIAAAGDEGFTLDDATLQSDFDAYMTALQSEALTSGYQTADQYIAAAMGEYMTVDLFQDIYTEQAIAMAYLEGKGAEIEITDDDMTAYYNENKDVLDNYNLSYTVHLATEPTAEEGETLTDDQLAAGLEEAKTEQKANAEAIAEKLAAGESIVDLGEEYETYGAYENSIVMGSSLNSSFSEWAMSADRQPGDITVAEYDGGSRYVYYVVRFEERFQDNAPTANIRHILVEAGTTPTDAEYDEAYTKAEGLLEQWKSGDATAESFGTLAIINSADPSSAQNGGVITGITANGQYIPAFQDWCVDESRQPGDTGFVKNEDSSTKGWHLMYFENWGDAQWKMIAKAALTEEQLTAIHDSLVADVPAQLASGASMVG